MVGGRLGKLQTVCHPVILHGKYPLTKLLVMSKHVFLLHVGPTLLMSALSANLHIVGARRLVRTICKSCITCKKVSATTGQQMMGQLPSHRVTPNPPFSKTGLDFAEPFTLKKGHTRRPVLIKAYVCVFVCFATKVAHLELVSDLTSEAFLAALRRFISRRGLPTDISSDNGSNFVGANNTLTDLYAFLSLSSTQDSICSYTAQQQITWHFSPERAPHFGGLWESLV